MKFTVEWLKAALIRAIRTAAQVALGMFTVGMAINEVQWMQVLSVSAVSAIYSLITSIATDLPELDKAPLIPDGSLTIDESDPYVYGMFVNLGDKSLEEVSKKKQVILDVKTGSVIEDKSASEQ